MDPLSIAMLFASFFSIVGTRISAIEAEKTAEKNLQFQKDTLLKQEQMANTSHTREVSDLRSAGLSPYVSTGGSPVPNFDSPQLDLSDKFAFDRQGLDNSVNLMAENNRHSEKVAELSEKIDMDSFQKKLQTAQFGLNESMSNIKSRQAEIDNALTKAQTDKTINEEERAKKIFSLTLEQKELDKQLTHARYIQQELDNEYLADTMKDRVHNVKLQNEFIESQKSKINTDIARIIMEMDLDREKLKTDKEYKSSMIKAINDKLKHEKHYDWAKFGLDSVVSVGKVVKDFIDFIPFKNKIGF